MTVHVQTDRTAPKAYLRRGHIAALWWQLVALCQLAILRRRQKRELARLRIYTDEMPDYLKRDIGLL